MLRPLSMIVLCGLLAVPCGDRSAQAGEYNEVLSVGDKAPTWEKLPATDGKSYASSDFEDKSVLVVVFTCASCPTAVDYEARIDALSRKYGGEQGTAAVVAICVNRVPEDQLPALTERAKAKGFHFKYLYDESQESAKSFGAIFTPQFFVLNKERKVVYMGAMDDSTEPESVKRSYVEEAIAAIQAGKAPETTETIARGCRVRYARERRKN